MTQFCLFFCVIFCVLFSSQSSDLIFYNVTTTLTSSSSLTYGSSLVLTNSTSLLVVGAPDDQSVFVYTNNDQKGFDAVLIQTITTTPATNNQSNFGISLSIAPSGSFLAVGDSLYRNNTGRVLLYSYSRINNLFLPSIAIDSPFTTNNPISSTPSFFGISLSQVANGYIAVGAYGGAAGVAVYNVTRAPFSASLVCVISPPSLSSSSSSSSSFSSFFGFAVGLSADILVVGAYEYSTYGNVFVYLTQNVSSSASSSSSSATFSSVPELAADLSSGAPNFGYSLAVSSLFIVVGAPVLSSSDGAGLGLVGEVFVYYYFLTQSGMLENNAAADVADAAAAARGVGGGMMLTISPSSVLKGSNADMFNFGSTVCISSSSHLIVVGSGGVESPGAQPISVYALVYNDGDYQTATYVLISTVKPSAPLQQQSSSSCMFGSALALGFSSDLIVAGDPLYHNASGVAYVFESYSVPFLPGFEPTAAPTSLGDALLIGSITITTTQVTVIVLFVLAAISLLLTLLVYHARSAHAELPSNSPLLSLLVIIHSYIVHYCTCCFSSPSYRSRTAGTGQGGAEQGGGGVNNLSLLQNINDQNRASEGHIDPAGTEVRPHLVEFSSIEIFPLAFSFLAGATNVYSIIQFYRLGTRYDIILANCMIAVRVETVLVSAFLIRRATTAPHCFNLVPGLLRSRTSLWCSIVLMSAFDPPLIRFLPFRSTFFSERSRGY